MWCEVGSYDRVMRFLLIPYPETYRRYTVFPKMPCGLFFCQIKWQKRQKWQKEEREKRWLFLQRVWGVTRFQIIALISYHINMPNSKRITTGFLEEMVMKLWWYSEFSVASEFCGVFAWSRVRKPYRIIQKSSRNRLEAMSTFDVLCRASSNMNARDKSVKVINLWLCFVKRNFRSIAWRSSTSNKIS